MYSVYHRYVYLSRGQDQNCRCALELSLLQASLLACLMLFVFGLSFLAGEHSMKNHDWHELQRKLLWRHGQDFC